MNGEDWYKKSCTKTLEELSVDKSKGLSKKEVESRQASQGLNVLPKKKRKSIISIFFNEFKDPIIIVLLIAAFLSFIVGEIVDSLAIVLIVLLDMLLATFEEYKANQNAESLQNLIKVEVKVIREGQPVVVDSSNLVVGDILVLESGNKISADARIIESKNLTVDESVLTGESLNVEKNNETLRRTLPVYKRKNMIYAGTSVITGRALAVVTAISTNTEIGKIAHEVNNTEEEKSPLTIRIDKFSKQISLFIIIIAIIISIVLKSKGFEGTEIFLSVIALAVSAMPEGLPLALTMALTIGSNRMLKKNVIVKKLNAVESLGSCTVIASDKTGTLTVNEQTAKKILLPDGKVFEVSGAGYNDKGKIKGTTDELENIRLLMESICINNEATLIKEKSDWVKYGDSIDIAFLALGRKYKKSIDFDISSIVKKDIIPYESENKYSAVFYEKDNNNYCTVKGSTEVILDFCDYMRVNNKRTKIDKEQILKQNNDLAKEGYRVIAVASSKLNKKYDPSKIEKLEFLGLFAFIDPIREDVIDSINKCKKAGIKVVMITGDHPYTAFAISKDIGIAQYFNDVTTSEEIEIYLNKSEIEFDNFIRNKTVFSRVTPLQKLKIVESYKRQGEFVAVTGDGVNDAPAIKSANIGISMGSGTDVAKETSSMIITNDNFTSIVDGIEEGRVAYSNIRKICYLLLSCGISEVLFFLLSITCNLPMPLVAIQLLWINIVTDGLQDLALSFEKSEDDIMNDTPRNPKESLFDKNLILEVLISGIFIGLLVFAVWYYLINIAKADTSIARGYILVLMVFIQNIHVLNCRSEKNSTFKISLKKNPFVIFSILSAILIQILFMEVPILSRFLQTSSIPFTDIIGLFVISIPVLIVMELYKLIRFYHSEEK